MRTRFLAASLAAFAASVPLAVAAPLAASARQDVPAPPPVVTPCANAVSTNSGVVMRGANLVSANFKVTNCSTVDEVVYPQLIDLGFAYGDATQTPCATGDYPFGQPGPVTIKAGSSWTYKTWFPGPAPRRVNSVVSTWSCWTPLAVSGWAAAAVPCSAGRRRPSPDP